MNKKQLISMWAGIGLIILLCMQAEGTLSKYEFRQFVFVIVLVTGGLIITFADKKGNKSKDDQNNKHGNC